MYRFHEEGFYLTCGVTTCFFFFVCLLFLNLSELRHALVGSWQMTVYILTVVKQSQSHWQNLYWITAGALVENLPTLKLWAEGLVLLEGSKSKAYLLFCVTLASLKCLRLCCVVGKL